MVRRDVCFRALGSIEYSQQFGRSRGGMGRRNGVDRDVDSCKTGERCPIREAAIKRGLSMGSTGSNEYNKSNGFNKSNEFNKESGFNERQSNSSTKQMH